MDMHWNCLKKGGQLLVASSIVGALIAGCGGGGGGTSAGSNTTQTALTLSGVAAVGSPIVNGSIAAKCAAGSPPATTTNSKGAWTMTLGNGTLLPCAVQVSGGTINTVANTTPYHSIAVSTGVVNVTPLTDLMVANLAGTATPDIWFTGLTTNPAQLTTITQPKVDTTLAKLRVALSGLTPFSLVNINPVTTPFAPVTGNVIDDMLTSLETAMANTGVTYTSLLSNASAPAYTAPVAGFNTALSSAYVGTTSGSATSATLITISGYSSAAAQAGGALAGFIQIQRTGADPCVTPPASATGFVVAKRQGSYLFNDFYFDSVSPGKYPDTIYYVIRESVIPTISSTDRLATIPFFANGTSSVNNDNDSGGAFYAVEATNSCGLKSISSSFNSLMPKPIITSMSPTSGSVGTTVTITGNYFSTTPSKNTVLFNGVPAVVSINSFDTSLIVTVPSGATTGTISVTTASGTTTSAGNFTIGGGATSQPTVSVLSPTTGVIGTVVTITGTNFSATPANNTVKFNGVEAAVTSSTTTSLTVAVPSGATTGTVSVTTAGGTAISAGSFTVSASSTPINTLALAGSINGISNFTFTAPPTIQPNYQYCALNVLSCSNAKWLDSTSTLSVTVHESILDAATNQLLVKVEDVPGASRYWSLYCTNKGTTAYPSCTSYGISFDRTTGTLTFTNQFYVTGTLTFTPY